MLVWKAITRGDLDCDRLDEAALGEPNACVRVVGDQVDGRVRGDVVADSSA
jgi:hypothetical protein